MGVLVPSPIRPLVFATGVTGIPMPQEEWRKTHHPNYEVSSLGQVRSRAQGPWRILRPSANKKGYLHIGIDGPHYYIHRLVAVAFLGPCPEGQEVMHKDHIPSHNYVENLAFGTSTENNQASAKIGRRALKLTTKQVESILTSTEPRRQIARAFGVSHTLVRYIQQRKVWAHV